MAVMNAAVLHGVKDLRLDQVAAPRGPAGPDDVLIAMRSVGLCGSDVHYWQEGRIGSFVLDEPMILGHECAGEVVETGANVRHLAIGDRVAIEPGIPCRVCPLCVTGRYNLCVNMRFFATPPDDGALAEYVSHPAALAFKLPENMTYEDAAMLEPFSVGLHAVRRAAVGPGSSVLILGAGPVGLLCQMAAQAAGATRVFAVDVKEDRLEKARELGASGRYNASDPDLAEKLRMETDGLGPEVVLECSGAPPAVRQSVELARAGGMVVWVGVGPASFEFPTLTVGLKELDVKGLFRYRNTWPAAIELVSSGRVNVRSLVTHRFGLPQVLDAFETTRTAKDGAIKVVVNL